MNDEYSKNIAKNLKKQGMGELSPGSTGRRYDPEGGVNNLNKRIHRESEYTDKKKNMPFAFSKPKKAKTSTVKVCSNCDTFVSVHKDTVGIICRHCKAYASVKEVSIEKE